MLREVVAYIRDLTALLADLPNEDATSDGDSIIKQHQDCTRVVTDVSAQDITFTEGELNLIDHILNSQ